MLAISSSTVRYTRKWYKENHFFHVTKEMSHVYDSPHANLLHFRYYVGRGKNHYNTKTILQQSLP